MNYRDNVVLNSCRGHYNLGGLRPVFRRKCAIRRFIENFTQNRVCLDAFIVHTAHTFFFSISAVNGNVREEIVTNKTSLQISDLLTKLTNQSGLDIIRIRKPFHTDNPSIQGQWHPFTNRPPSIGPIKPQKPDAKY